MRHRDGGVKRKNNMNHLPELLELSDAELDAVAAGVHGPALVDVDVILKDIDVDIPVDIDIRNVNVAVQAVVAGRAIQTVT